jgi:hypothetical protein
MTQKKNATKFLIYVPKGREREFELYKKIVREMGLTVNERIWSMIFSDLETVMMLIENIMKKEIKQ